MLFSLLVARLITPLMAAYIMRSKPTAHGVKDGALMRGYMRLLRWTLRNRTITLLAGVAIFAASIYSATLLPQEFVPPSRYRPFGRRGRTGARRHPGRGAQRRTGDHHPHPAWCPRCSASLPIGASPTALSFQVNYGDRSERTRSWTEINDDIAARLADLPDLRVFVLGEEGQHDITINVLADTEAAAAQAANALLRQMHTMPELRYATSAAALMRPEIRIIPDPERAAELGVTAAALASAVRVATIGDLDANLAQFDAGEERIPIRVRLNEAARTDVSRLIGFRVPSSRGGDGAAGRHRPDRTRLRGQRDPAL